MSLSLKNISLQVAGELHIDNISLELEPGTFNILLGRTLSGKTSLMRLMAGLDRPSKGRVLIDDEDVTGLSVRKRDVAMVYQQFINYPSMSVYQNIASPLRLAKIPPAEIDRRVREVAEMLHIEALLERLPVELSGGQQQRTAIARALVKDTELLLLDEPLVNLDYKLREELRIEMREIFKRRKSIVVYATTEPLEALALAGNTAVLYEGRLEQFGPTIDVYQHPRSIRIAQAFSDPAMNFIDGRVVDGSLLFDEGSKVPLQQLDSLPAGDYRFGMRANHLRLESGTATDIAFQVNVDLAEISGSETFLHVTHQDCQWTVQLQGVHKHRMGEQLQVYVDPCCLYVFNQQGERVASPCQTTAA